MCVWIGCGGGCVCGRGQGECIGVGVCGRYIRVRQIWLRGYGRGQGECMWVWVYLGKVDLDGLGGEGIIGWGRMCRVCKVR